MTDKLRADHDELIKTGNEWYEAFHNKRIECDSLRQAWEGGKQIIKMLEAERDQLRAEVDRLTAQCRLFDAAAYKAKVEARTLVEDMQSRITVLEGQEPVAIVRRCRVEGVIINGNNDEISVNLPPGTKLFLAAGAAPTTQESCKHGTPYRYPCDVCDTPTLEQLIIKENDRVLQESLEGKYAMAQAAPTKHDVEIRQHGKDEPYVSYRSKAVCDLLEEHLPVKLYTRFAPKEPLTDEQIEAGRKAIFSTDNPYCPCDSKTMRKAVQWAERKHGIGGKV